MSVLPPVSYDPRATPYSAKVWTLRHETSRITYGRILMLDMHAPVIEAVNNSESEFEMIREQVAK